MDLLSPLFTAAATIIQTALPETDPANGGGGAWLALELRREPFVNLCKAGRLPIIAIDLPLRASTEWGMANRTWAGEMVVYYTVAQDNEVVTVLERLEVLHDAFWPTPAGLSYAEVIAQPYPNLDLYLPPNRYFGQAGLPFFCGAIHVPLIVQQQAPFG